MDLDLVDELDLDLVDELDLDLVGTDLAAGSAATPTRRQPSPRRPAHSASR